MCSLAELVSTERKCVAKEINVSILERLQRYISLVKYLRNIGSDREKCINTIYSRNCFYGN